MMREGRLIAPDGFVVASLQGFHQHMKEPKEEGGPLRYAFGWLTSFRPEDSIIVHHEAILDLISSLAQEEIIDPERVFLLGFSQTCALNFRFGFTHPDVLRGIVGICGGIPGDWDVNDLYKQTNASVLYLHGERDEFYPPARVRGYKEQLLKRASDVQVRSYDAAHEITQAMRDDVRAWLKERGAI
jgi:phospholipase/carboxylesterase